MSLYLAFDIGTTGLKTALVDQDGRVLDVCVTEYAFSVPGAGMAEMDPNAYWNAAVQGTRSVFARSGADRRDLAAIGFSSQGQTFVPVDTSGEPLHNAIVWIDRRAEGIVEAWQREWLTRNEYRRTTGYPWIAAELTLFKLAWFERNRPEGERVWKYLCLPDYLIFRMTGGTFTDHVMAQFTGCWNIETQKWDPGLLDAAGIAADKLPSVVPSGTAVGSLRQDAADELGIPAGVTVCVGANDQIAGALGSGNVAAGIVSETTGSCLAVIASTERASDDETAFAGRHAAPGLGFSIAMSVSSGLVLKWFRDLCAPGESYDEFLGGVGLIPMGCDGLTMLPHLCGTGTPDFNSSARGAFIGLTPGHTRAHMARAIMEGVCCQLRECVEAIAHTGGAAESVRSLGGAAKSDLWVQMKADMLGLPVERPVCADAASLGAAIMAAAGTGQFSSIQDASLAWYRAERRFEPSPETEAPCREVYESYKGLTTKLFG